MLFRMMTENFSNINKTCRSSQEEQTSRLKANIFTLRLICDEEREFLIKCPVDYIEEILRRTPGSRLLDQRPTPDGMVSLTIRSTLRPPQWYQCAPSEQHTSSSPVGENLQVN